MQNLNINNNSFDCSLPLGNDIKDLKHYILNKSIKSDEICGMKKRRQKFERLQMTVEDPVQQNGWLYDEDIETDQNDTVVDCKTETPINGTEHVFVRHLVRIIELSPTLFTLFLLVFGFTLGKQMIWWSPPVVVMPEDSCLVFSMFYHKTVPCVIVDQSLRHSIKLKVNNPMVLNLENMVSKKPISILINWLRWSR